MFDVAINKRVNELLESLEISQEELRKELGIKSKQQISNWINCNEKVPEKHILSIVRVYKNVNARWLITGDGEMFISKKSETKTSIVSESKAKYQNGNDCKTCRDKDVEIRLLDRQVKEKEEKIYELQKAVGALEQQLYGGNDSNGKDHNRATG